MRKKATHKKRIEYPEETNGTRWAAEARRMGSKLTPEQEAKHFARAMVKIYGGQPKKSLALDANLLLDLVEEKDFAHEFREEFARRGYAFLIPPTVGVELDLLATFGGMPQR